MLAYKKSANIDDPILRCNGVDFQYQIAHLYYNLVITKPKE